MSKTRPLTSRGPGMIEQPETKLNKWGWRRLPQEHTGRTSHNLEESEWGCLEEAFLKFNVRVAMGLGRVGQGTARVWAQRWQRAWVLREQRAAPAAKAGREEAEVEAEVGLAAETAWYNTGPSSSDQIPVPISQVGPSNPRDESKGPDLGRQAVAFLWLLFFSFFFF
jgi:hypothetical protein